MLNQRRPHVNENQTLETLIPKVRLCPEGAMALENLVERLQGEASCPICREHFKDPAVIDCGHSFCQACISQPNRQLAIVLEIAKELSLQVLKGSGVEKMCAKHQETLKLFCAEDQAPICVVCDRSRIHRAHKVVPIEEAAQEYKVSGEGKARQSGKESRRAGAWVGQTEVERQLVVSEWEQLCQFVAKQECLLLARLEELEKEIGRRREENATRLCEDISRLSALITELEGKCCQLAPELLQVRLCQMHPEPRPEGPRMQKQESGLLGQGRGMMEKGCSRSVPLLPRKLMAYWSVLVGVWPTDQGE
uniref:Uncharacterized protein n=1 Tax=Pelusios castaneus TaxID=367368 RepID=A0A8C8SSR2_9SAUR